MTDQPKPNEPDAPDAEDVQKALAKAEMLRTYPMKYRWHLVTLADEVLRLRRVVEPRSVMVAVLMAGKNVVGWTNDMAWAARWANQLECRHFTSVQEIVPNK